MIIPIVYSVGTILTSVICGFLDGKSEKKDQMGVPLVLVCAMLWPLLLFPVIGFILGDRSRHAVAGKKD